MNTRPSSSDSLGQTDHGGILPSPNPTQIVRKRLSLVTLLLLPLGVGLALGLGVSLISWFQEKQTQLIFYGLDGNCLYLSIVCLLALLSMLIAACAPSTRRWFAFMAVLLAVACYASSYFLKVDGFYGDRTPRIVWRWTATAEQKVHAYLVTKPKELIALTPELLEPTNADWPQLLGKNRTGVLHGVGLETNWADCSPKLLWRHPVGLGWSSFAILGNVAIDMEQRDENESIVCYNLRNGKELWCHQSAGRFRHEHGDGPRTTPTIYNGRVYALGAMGALYCVDLANGSLLWKQEVFENPTTQNLAFGMSGSPLVVNDQVIVTPGAGKDAATIAYSCSTGRELWRSGDDKASYASPVLASLLGESQILSFNGDGLRAYDIHGASLWLQPWVTQGESRVNVAQPIAISDSTRANVLISSGYDMGTALVEVTRIDGRWNSRIVWESKQLKSKLSNCLVHENYVYGFDNGILTCLDLRDGSRQWKRGRYGHGKMLLIDDLLLIQAESGEIVLVNATHEGHQELAKLEALNGRTWNYPALSGDILVVRNDHEAAAYQLPLKHDQSPLASSSKRASLAQN